MATVQFTQNVQRHIRCPSIEATGLNLREVLNNAFSQHPEARDYFLTEQGALREHIVAFIDGTASVDRKELSDPTTDRSEIYLMQALSGG